MGVYLRGKWYHYKKQIEGRAYYRSLKLHKGQEQFLSRKLQQVEEEIIAQHFGFEYIAHSEIRFKDYILEYEKQKSKKSTISRDIQNLNVIASCWGDPILSSIGKKEIQKLEDFLFKRKIKAATVNRYFEILHHFFELAIEDKHITDNPCRFFEWFTEDGSRRELSDQEIISVLLSAKNIQDNSKTPVQSIIFDAILFGLATGTRLSEVLKLKKSYIQGGEILFPITATKARRRSRTRQRKRYKEVLLNDLAKAIIAKQTNPGQYVFIKPTRDPHAMIRKTIKKIRKDSGVSDFTFHMLRHKASSIITSLVSLPSAKVLLGHADLQTTLRYSHASASEMKKGVEKLETYVKALLPR